MTDELLYLGRLGPDAALLGEVVVEVGPIRLADVVWTGSEWFVAWEPLDGTTIELQRFARDGSPVGPQAFVVLEAPRFTRWSSQIRLVHTPGRGVELLRLVDGHLMLQVLGDGSAPGAPILLTEAREFDVDVSPSGDLGVAFTTNESLPRLVARRYDGDGTPVGSAVAHMPGFADGTAHEPAVAWAGSDFLVAYRRLIYVDPETDWFIAVAAFSSPTGWISLERYRYTYPTSGPIPRRLRRPALDVQDGVALVVWQWQDPRALAGVMRMQRVRLGVESTPLEPLAEPVVHPVIDDGAISVRWTTPSAAVVAWPDVRWGATDLYTAPVGLTGCPP